VTVGVSYYQGPFPEKPGSDYGRVARYAWGEDYHPLILSRLNQLAVALSKEWNASFQATAAIDTKPLLERSLARASGVGFIGKNTLLIVPRSAHTQFHAGSFLFLGEILISTDMSELVTPAEAGVQASNLDSGSRRNDNLQGCGGCTKCLTNCPTDAFDGPFKLKAGRCIAYLTIENKGWIARELREKIGDWVFGCDVCQDVCPFNARALETRWPEFSAARGAGAWVSLRDILSLRTTGEFKEKWGSTALARPKRRGLMRNAAVAAGNSGDESLVPLLKTLLLDEEPVVRGHALWALSCLSPALAKYEAEALLHTDPDDNVKNECTLVLAA